MTYQVNFAKAASKQLSSLPLSVQRQLQPIIDALSLDPRPSGVKKLKGSARYRIRSGDYRVIYEIQDQALIVLVVEVGKRDQVYR